MLTISAYQNGATAHIPNGGVSMHERAKRSTIQGWTKEAVRRHTKWLYSVDHRALDGHGYAVTLTLRECPESSAKWHAMRRAWLRRVERMGTIRAHWVVEWQRRGVPHMHTALYFDRQLTAVEKFLLVQHWIDVAEGYGAQHGAQYLLPITGASGWLQYLSKHAARGAFHYQRAGKPAGWETTGRLWGHTGEWPVNPALKFQVTDREGQFAYRRMIRSWRIANARKIEDPKKRAKAIVSARTMLKFNDRKLSEVRGISEWTDQDLVVKFVGCLADNGHEVIQLDG